MRGITLIPTFSHQGRRGYYEAIPDVHLFIPVRAIRQAFMHHLMGFRRGKGHFRFKAGHVDLGERLNTGQPIDYVGIKFFHVWISRVQSGLLRQIQKKFLWTALV